MPDGRGKLTPVMDQDEGKPDLVYREPEHRPLWVHETGKKQPHCKVCGRSQSDHDALRGRALSSGEPEELGPGTRFAVVPTREEYARMGYDARTFDTRFRGKQPGDRIEDA